MMILPMCSDSRSPMFCHVRPASTDLYTPSPYETARWALFSPVPTQTTFGCLGSTTIVPMEYVLWRSKTGLHVVPEFVVFQTPPAAAPTYQVFLSPGSTARSVIRPEITPGLIERRRKPSYGDRLAGAVSLVVARGVAAGAL